MKASKRVLLKITGTLFTAEQRAHLDNLITNIQTVSDQIYFGIVVGGGNIFRGSEQGTQLGLRADTGHTVGMIATLINALILDDKLLQAGVRSRVLSSFDCPSAASVINPAHIQEAQATNTILIFAGGTGAPFFSTDTNAIVRGLQIDADEIWKMSNVDGVYTQDPRKNAHATLIDRITHQEALNTSLGILDKTALQLAAEHNLSIRVGNILQKDALTRMATSSAYGSIITTKE